MFKEDSKKEIITKFGMACKGVIFILIGLLTTLAVFEKESENTNKKDVLRFLEQQPLGNVMLIALGFGLLGYLFYRFYQAFYNTMYHKKNFSGYVLRGSYVMSGLIYGILGLTSLKMGFGGSDDVTYWIVEHMNSEYGNIIAIVIAISLLIKSISDFYLAYTGRYKIEVKQNELNPKVRKLLVTSGQIGFSARGLVAIIFSFLFFKASFNDTTNEIDRADVFNFMQNEFGKIILVIVAISISTYGIYMLIKSKYPDVNIK